MASSLFATFSLSFKRYPHPPCLGRVTDLGPLQTVVAVGWYGHGSDVRGCKHPCSLYPCPAEPPVSLSNVSWPLLCVCYSGVSQNPPKLLAHPFIAGWKRVQGASWWPPGVKQTVNFIPSDSDSYIWMHCNFLTEHFCSFLLVVQFGC